jgi:hypothetical protein
MKLLKLLRRELSYSRTWYFFNSTRAKLVRLYRRFSRNVKFSMNSSLLCLTPPCLYHVFDGFLDDLEEQENEYIRERANETVGGVKRMDLPKDHPEYVALEECKIDWAKAKEIIAKIWLDTLREWIIMRSDTDGINSIDVTFKDTWSPREYNFHSDECGFFLSASKKELEKIIRMCLTDHCASFGQYLKEHHSSYEGFWSYMSDDIGDYNEYWRQFKRGEMNRNVEHLVWACLDFWLLGIEDMGGSDNVFESNQSRFDADLWDNVFNAEGNGEFFGIMEYSPVEEMKAA